MNVKRTKLCLCRSLLLMAGLLFAVASFAQDLTVKGKVTDTTGETVIGANVTVKGTTNGIITDIDGNYTLSGVKAFFRPCFLLYWLQNTRDPL